jgi:hypothetical protein
MLNSTIDYLKSKFHIFILDLFLQFFSKKLAIVFGCCYDGDLLESLCLKGSWVEIKS